MTLNSTTDQVEYRVWDYPIKEQYGHILQSINQAGLLNSTEEGFQKVEWDKFLLTATERLAFADFRSKCFVPDLMYR